MASAYLWELGENSIQVNYLCCYYCESRYNINKIAKRVLPHYLYDGKYEFRGFCKKHAKGHEKYLFMMDEEMLKYFFTERIIEYVHNS